jgi:hypothetical protein
MIALADVGRKGHHSNETATSAHGSRVGCIHSEPERLIIATIVTTGPKVTIVVAVALGVLILLFILPTMGGYAQTRPTSRG